TAVIRFGAGGAAKATASGTRSHGFDGFTQRGVVFLTLAAAFQHKAVVVRRSQAQLSPDFKGLTLAIAVVDIVFLTIGLLTIDLQTQQAVFDRPAQHEVALEDIA